MAELVDALVSNTNGESRAGSSPAQGTDSRGADFSAPLFVLLLKIFSSQQALYIPDPYTGMMYFALNIRIFKLI